MPPGKPYLLQDNRTTTLSRVTSQTNVESSSTAQVPESTVQRKNEKHSRKLQWGSGGQHDHEVKVPKLISDLLYYTFWDLFVRVYMSLAGHVAFNDNPVQLTFNIFITLFSCLKNKDPVNHYMPPSVKDRNNLLMAFHPQEYILLSGCFLFFPGFLQESHIELCPLSKIV